MTYPPGHVMQGEKWTTNDGRILDVSDMELSHVFNTLNFLRKRAAGLANAWTMECLTMPWPDDDTAAADLFNGEWEREQDEMQADPVAWLNGTPLAKALQARLDEASAVKKNTEGYL